MNKENISSHKIKNSVLLAGVTLAMGLVSVNSVKADNNPAPKIDQSSNQQIIKDEFNVSKIQEANNVHVAKVAAVYCKIEVHNYAT